MRSSMYCVRWSFSFSQQRGASACSRSAPSFSSNRFLEGDWVTRGGRRLRGPPREFSF